VKRSLAVIALAAVAGIATAAYMTHGPHHLIAADPLPPHTATPDPSGPLAVAVPAGPVVAVLSAAQIRATATRWVTALWTRPPGQGPFDWLNAVADITAPDLAAQLRTAQPTLDAQLTLSVTVDIDGVYPSAVDPGTVTVTCVAHRRMTTGPIDQPCATTVTVRPGPGGAPTVTDVQ
jgi:hypothetical protein